MPRKISISLASSLALALALALALGISGCDRSENSDDASAKTKVDVGLRGAAGGGGADGAGDEGADEGAGANADGAAADGGDEADGGDAAPEDEGSVRLKIGDAQAQWNADKAKAKIEEGARRKLRIQATVVEHEGESTRGAQLRLLAWDYAGPGEYKLVGPNSTLAGVRIDHGGASKAERDEDPAQADENMKKATKAGILAGARSAIVFMNAKLVVTKERDGFVDGTLDWSGVTAGGAT
jgi:hypothetical protein